ncbi:hypothetical protein EJ05DRAFT_502251 [Pseudovirgaria hyperparasitica]|uniref:Rhodopsin domain-containing protein n=1 Tax=Pseudovirgaria hyperparasitica TaxID=470096 RepID=A0A6A6W3N6_9PEZI|nr:uncharacterized protein EJ05DRAFT_502251 [Pseudovirgaria hyperparasitica]KAF2756759.1 hypothetical protein EJ05DRAFT_502251 [Pseudovirgaria hyperparasitica]
MSVLSFGAVTVRLLQRKILSGTYKQHDWFILAATVFGIAMSLGLIISTSFGLGTHESDLEFLNGIRMRQAVLVTNIFYLSCNMLVKLSLLQFYRDLTMSTPAHYFIHFMTFVSVGFGASSIIVVLAQCVPMARIFDPTVPGTCSNIRFMDFSISNGFLMMGIDTVLYAMPVVFTWNLQVSRASKVGLYFVFGLGLVVLIASALRVWIMYEIKSTGDMAFQYGQLMLCSTIENHLAIAVACAPYIKTFLRNSLLTRAYASFRSRIITIVAAATAPSADKSNNNHYNHHHNNNNDDDDDNDRITSLGPASGPPMIPPVRVHGGFRNAFRTCEFFSQLTGRWTVRVGDGTGAGTGLGYAEREGDVEMNAGLGRHAGDDMRSHPALRSEQEQEEQDQGWDVVGPEGDDGSEKEGVVVVRLDGVRLSEGSSRYSTPVGTSPGPVVLEKGYFGDRV